MASLSDMIEKYILHVVQEGEGEISLKRNDLSSMFSCVPSQINYVIKTRFTLERGYLVESRRGGGGFLRIVKISAEEAVPYLEQIREGSADYLSGESARHFLDRLEEEGILNGREGKLLWQLLKDESLPRERGERGTTRSRMLRNLIAYLLKEEAK